MERQPIIHRRRPFQHTKILRRIILPSPTKTILPNDDSTDQQTSIHARVVVDWVC